MRWSISLLGFFVVLASTFIGYTVSVKAQVQELWRDDFNDNVTAEYDGDHYSQGWGAFTTVSENGGLLKLSDPSSYNNYFWISTGKNEGYFPAGTTVKARIRINSNRNQGWLGEDAVYADSTQGTNYFENNNWITVTYSPDLEFSRIWFKITWQDGSWNNETDSVDVDWISISGDPDSYTGGEHLWTKKIQGHVPYNNSYRA
jgi:hypothetical protein